MSAKSNSIAAIAMAVLGLTACTPPAGPGLGKAPASKPRPTPVSKAPRAAPPGDSPASHPETSSRYEADPAARDAGGHYAARYVTGDYAGYPELERFIDRMAREHGFSHSYLNGLFSQARRKQWTLDYLARTSKPGAPPRPGAWTRYRTKFLTEQHISKGAAFWSKYAGALRRAKAEYGVNPEHILGIMGVETIYGGNLGSHRIIDALTTLAFDYPRRAEYFTGELENFLIMAREEGVDPSRPVGSFAGAMGLGQFMPSSFLKFAVDFDGNGRRDLWNPVDAIGSIANYFAGHGWQPDKPVVIPAIVSGSAARELESGFKTRYSLASLAGYGVKPAARVPDSGSIRLLRLSTANGDEYWLGLENFYVITRYNHSTHYAMAVHQLAGAIKNRYTHRLASLQ